MIKMYFVGVVFVSRQHEYIVYVVRSVCISNEMENCYYVSERFVVISTKQMVGTDASDER